MKLIKKQMYFCTNLTFCSCLEKYGCLVHKEDKYSTRMHSSRMRTDRSSSRQGGLPQCMLGYTHTPVCGPGKPPPPPPGVGLETPNLARPLNFPPWVWAWKPSRHAGIPPPPPPPETYCKSCWDTTPLLWTEWLTDGCKNITSANFVCGR